MNKIESKIRNKNTVKSKKWSINWCQIWDNNELNIRIENMLTFMAKLNQREDRAIIGISHELVPNKWWNITKELLNISIRYDNKCKTN